MNRDNVIAVRDRIEEVGDDHCNMLWWSYGQVSSSGELDCGTAACIAGWAMAMKYGKYDKTQFTDEETVEQAKEWLGIESHVSPNLFYHFAWPQEYIDLYNNAGASKAMVTILNDILNGELDINTCRA
jgi:hypothetical protein